MSDYIPRDMIQKQLLLEWMNTYLYRRLERDNPYPKLQEAIAGLVRIQERQIQALEKLSHFQGAWRRAGSPGRDREACGEWSVTGKA